MVNRIACALRCLLGLAAVTSAEPIDTREFGLFHIGMSQAAINARVGEEENHMFRIKRMVSRITVIVRRVAERERPYTTIEEYNRARCAFMARVAEKAAQFRDTGGSMQEFLDIIKKTTLDDNEDVKTDKLAIALTMATVAYASRSSPKKIRDNIMKACIEEMASEKQHQKKD